MTTLNLGLGTKSSSILSCDFDYSKVEQKYSFLEGTTADLDAKLFRDMEKFADETIIECVIDVEEEGKMLREMNIVSFNFAKAELERYMSNRYPTAHVELLEGRYIKLVLSLGEIKTIAKETEGEGKRRVRVAYKIVKPVRK
jgi:hypothetical protein